MHSSVGMLSYASATLFFNKSGNQLIIRHYAASATQSAFSGALSRNLLTERLDSEDAILSIRSTASFDGFHKPPSMWVKHDETCATAS